jgi:hypothetical protein
MKWDWTGSTGVRETSAEVTAQVSASGDISALEMKCWELIWKRSQNKDQLVLAGDSIWQI